MLSSDFSNGDVTRERSGTSTDSPAVPSGKNPSTNPDTVVTPVTTTSLVFTAVTLANVLLFLPRPPNFKILPTFTFPGNWGFPLVIVLIPDPPLPVDDVTFAEPNINSSLSITSPVKVLAKPTSPLFWSVNPGPPNIDFTSLTPKLVTATDTREFSTPLNINGSFGMNSPFVS